MKIIAAVYSHPEYYPPTLNAIDQLSKHAEKIVILHRNVKLKEWKYPKNVSLRSSGKFKSIAETQDENIFWKVFSFINFSIIFFKALVIEKPDWVICYDAIPLLSFRITSYFFVRKPKLWYHNHDVLEFKNTRPFSISRLAFRSEKKYFKKIDLFTLPANERKTSFPMDEFKGNYIYIPNYPSLEFTKKEQHLNLDKKNIDFIFQGTISDYHGLEDMLYAIPHLNQELNKNFRLILKGFISKDYTEHLQNIAAENQIIKSLIIIGVGPYKEIFKISSKCDIGLAIHKADDLMNKTLATSSNKIYEYIAVGLPVLLYNNEHFTSHLKKRTWAFFTDTTRESIIENVKNILASYDACSKSALADFKNELNFESNFSLVIPYLSEK